MLYFENDTIKATRGSVSNSKLTMSSKYTITTEGTQSNYKITITNKTGQNVVTVTNKLKTMYLYKSNLSIEITSHIGNFNDNSYYKTNDAIITIKNNDVELKGKCKIFKDEIIVIHVHIEHINNISVHYDNELKQITNALNSNNEFDYELSYDEFKKLNLTEYCSKSLTLLKNFYNSNFNMFMIENTQLFELLKNKHGKLIVNMLNQRMETIKLSIISICNDDNKRNFMLKNVLKRIETHNPYINIQNRENKYVEMPQKFKVIFDTGNSSFSIIGKNIVDELGLQSIEFFSLSASGVGGHEKYTNGYANVSIKLNEKSPYYLPIEYSFVAVIDNNNLKDTLLLGHSSKIFMDFLKNNYCVGYNYDKLSNNTKTISELTILKNNILDNLKITSQLFNEYTTNNDINVLNTYLKILIELLLDILKYLPELINLNVGNVYTKVKLELQNVNSIKNTNIYKMQPIKTKVNMVDEIQKKLMQ